MRYGVVLFAVLLGFGGQVHLAGYALEMPYACSGVSSRTTSYPITDWNGRSRNKFSTKVYDFRIDCSGSYKHIVDVFLTSADSDRYQKRGGTLYKHTGDERKRVKVRDEECTLVPETVEVDPPSSDPCYYDIMHPNCDPSRRYWEQRMVERCSRAQYETRYVPQWEPFPTGYAPLPRGARIVKAAVPGSSGNGLSSSASFVGWALLVIIVGAIGVFTWKPIARFYYSAFVPHPAQKFLDNAIRNNTPLDMQGFERAMLEGTTMPFQDIMSAKASELRRALDKHAEMMRSAEERERARTRAKASAHFGRQVDEDYS